MSDKVSEALGPNKRGWAEILTEQYAGGADDIEVMAALRLSRKDFQGHYESNPVFRELVDVGRIAASAWWRGIARKHLFDKALNVPVWNFVMKNREGWAEKSESITNDVSEKQKSTDELRSELLARFPGMAKQLGAVKKEADVVLLPDTAVD